MQPYIFFIITMQSSQIQKSSPDQVSRMNSQFKREDRTKEQTLSALSTDPCIPSTESNEDLSQDILRQVTIKNQLLTAQLAQYKIMVQRLQKKVTLLSKENTELKRMIESKDKASGQIHLNAKEFKSTLPIQQKHQNILKADATILLSQVRDILNRYTSEVPSQKCSQEVIRKQLAEMASERQQMESFVGSLWHMKDMIEPGGEMLWELWEWLKVVGANYRDLLLSQAKPMRSRSRSRERRLA